jgi:hypothetical protein
MTEKNAWELVPFIILAIGVILAIFDLRRIHSQFKRDNVRVQPVERKT